MDVLEHDDGGPVAGEQFDEPAKGREQLLAVAGGRGAEPQHGEQSLPDPAAIRDVGQRGVELRERRGGVVRLEHARVGLEDLGEGPDTDPAPVGQGASDAPERLGIAGEHTLAQRGDETRLAEAGLTADRDDRGAAGRHDIVVGGREHAELRLAPDQRSRELEAPLGS